MFCFVVQILLASPPQCLVVDVIKELGVHLAELLEEDLEEIHYYLRVTTDIGNILCAIEKYFGGTANYAKGKVSMLMEYMRRYHPTAYRYPVYLYCSGLRQEIGVESAVAVIMNIPHYLELLVLRMSCGGDSILEKCISFCD